MGRNIRRQPIPTQHFRCSPIDPSEDRPRVCPADHDIMLIFRLGHGGCRARRARLRRPGIRALSWSAPRTRRHVLGEGMGSDGALRRRSDSGP